MQCISLFQQTFEDAEAKKGEEAEEEASADQLKQIIYNFSQGALSNTSEEPVEDDLYMTYANIMAKSCGGGDDEGEEDEDAPEPSLEEKEIEAMKLLFNQGRLAERGATEMVLTQITASKGNAGDMMESTLTLGKNYKTVLEKNPVKCKPTYLTYDFFHD